MKVVDSENNICAAALWDFFLEYDWAGKQSELSSREKYGPTANVPLCEALFGRVDKTFQGILGGKPCASECIHPVNPHSGMIIV